MAYRETLQMRGDRKVRVLAKHAAEHSISLNTVFHQVKSYAKASNLPALPISERAIHAVRNSGNDTLISQALFDPMPPEAERYIAACEHSFQSDFSHALARMIKENDTRPSYIQQVLDIPVQDALALHEELNH